jgi:Domain of Unknown Function (DUF1259)
VTKEAKMKPSMRWMLLALVLSTSSAAYADNTPPLNIGGIAKAMGREGTLSGDMYKVSFPRSDLTVKVGNVVIKPALALTAWAAFMKSGDAAVTYGDLVLLEDEINPVISKLEQQGIELSALHNHLLHETPRIMYIHFMGRGDEVAMAKGLRDAIALTTTPLVSTPSPSSPSEAKPDLASKIEKIIGLEGTMSGGVFHITVPRNDIHVMAMGAAIPSSMGMNTPLNFQLDGNNAAINGDFILLAPETNRVIKALRANGIEVVSVHNHMLDEEPRLVFMHFWANDDALKLAKGLRAALDETAVGKN